MTPRRALTVTAVVSFLTLGALLGVASGDARPSEASVETKLREQVRKGRTKRAKLRREVAKARRQKRAAVRTYRAQRRDLRTIGLYVSPREPAWLCIHSHEGAWNDPNPPYWGGLQMDMSFQRTYGPEFLARWGTADNWPVWAQIKAADRAHKRRGFAPWPTTARMCGLI